MSSATDLISRFKAEDTRSLEDIDKSRKPQIITDLEEFADDETVVDFLLSIASDENEFDLARIEAFKVFEIKEYESQEVRKRIATVIREVLLKSHDDQVLNYAAMAAASYMDNSEVVSEIERIVLDSKKDSDLRWNAFAAVKLNGPTPQLADTLRTLMADEEFKVSAERVLSEWNVG